MKKYIEPNTGSTHRKRAHWSRTALPMAVLLCCMLFHGCEQFVSVDLPNSQLTGEAVFTDLATATAAMADIYTRLRDGGPISGGTTGIDNLMGLYADGLDYYGDVSQPQARFHGHQILASDATIASWWNTSYGIIYAANSVIQGLGSVDAVPRTDRDRLIGEALVVRAYLHLYLTELFGDVPYVATTDYLANGRVSRMPRSEVYANILSDLTRAAGLLPYGDPTGEHIRPDRAVAQALLARAYLYVGQWEAAEALASDVISGSMLEQDLDMVFLKESTETLWQLGPEAEGRNTREAATFIIRVAPPRGSVISQSLLSAFEPGDLRMQSWVGTISDGTTTWYYPYKYKVWQQTAATEECSVLVRLGEMYLVRAEARARSGNLHGAKADLDRIRQRAGLPPSAAGSQDALLDAVWQERQVELFAEKGHRWLDLKRSGNAADVLAPLKPAWQDTDLLLPVPENEIVLNPGLEPQNPGY